MITWKRNRILIIAVVAAVLIAGIVVGGILLSGGSEKKVRKAIDLGMQYLSDLDYENAILSFRDAITIDPMNEEAKNNLITAYRTYAGICMTDGRYDRAAELCEELLAFAQTEDDYLLLAQAYEAQNTDITDFSIAESMPDLNIIR